MIGDDVGDGSQAPRVPLRIVLVALLVGLVAVALAVTGIVATSLLRGYLVDRQDGQLIAYLDRYSDPHRRVCPGGSAVTPSTLLVACVAPGSSEAVPVGAPPMLRPGDLPRIDREDARTLLRADGHPVTVPARDGGTSWRVVAGELPSGDVLLVGSNLGDVQQVIRRLVASEVLVGFVVLTVLGAAGHLLVRNSLRPLAAVERTAQAIAAGDLSQRVPAGDDRTEVGRLLTALNGMLTRIESAFRAQRASEEQARASEARMRRFVADAGHELRTPLTSIRGFAELYRQGAVRSAEETARLLERIEAEGARMGLLVEDLLQLARLDQQRPLSLAPVDLADLAGDAVHDARAVQPDRPIALHLDGSLTDAPVVLGDEARLRQVVGNLVNNALAHTPVTARVTVTLAQDPADDGVVLLQVADEGPGMAEADAERVFERFYRADTSRTRAAGGTGLGLAIVASLVAAHAGTVDLVTAPGRGATFTVRLPRSGPPGPAPAG